MRYIFYGLLVILFITVALKQDKKVRKDQLCKEGLFSQMIFKKCTPRKFLYNQEEQENI